MALFADRVDVTEELTRLRSHAGQMRALLSAAEPAGRKMDFLVQEMHREANTVGSKSQSAEIAAAACVRMGIDPADAADVEWLVLRHLRMANLAQRRDLSDPDLIHSFAAEAGTLDRLDKLYLLTYADIATVGPRTWTDWKARLLRELHEKTRALLEAGGERLRGGRRPAPEPEGRSGQVPFHRPGEVRR